MQQNSNDICIATNWFQDAKTMTEQAALNWSQMPVSRSRNFKNHVRMSEPLLDNVKLTIPIAISSDTGNGPCPKL